MPHSSKRRIRVTCLMPHSSKSRIRVASYKPNFLKSRIRIARMRSCCDSSATPSIVRISTPVIQTSRFKKLRSTFDLCYMKWSQPTTTRPKWLVSYSACWLTSMLWRRIVKIITQDVLTPNQSSQNKKKSSLSVKTRSTNKKSALSTMRKSLKS